MEFTLSAAHIELQAQIRELIARHIDDNVRQQAHATGTSHAAVFHQALGGAGILERAAPGEGQDPIAMWVLTSEAERAVVPFDATGMALIIAGLLRTVGTGARQERIGSRLLAGDDLVCFGLTEPDAGSDLAAINTRSERDGEAWIINGTKIWTTMAHVADWVFLLTRTDSARGRYDGFTAFLVPMDTPGITVDPIHTMGTERSNTTFYYDVRVGRELVIGAPGDGWRVLSTLLGFERGMANTGFLPPLLHRFAAWAAATGRIDDPVVRERMAQIAIDAEVAELLTQRTVWTAAAGRLAGTEGSIAKVHATEAYQRHAAWAQGTAAPESLLGFAAPGAAADGWIDHDVRHSVPQTLQGGTTEVNRNNIAERRLGLPRHR